MMAGCGPTGSKLARTRWRNGRKQWSGVFACAVHSCTGGILQRSNNQCNTSKTPHPLDNEVPRAPCHCSQHKFCGCVQHPARDRNPTQAAWSLLFRGQSCATQLRNSSSSSCTQPTCGPHGVRRIPDDHHAAAPVALWPHVLGRAYVDAVLHHCSVVGGPEHLLQGLRELVKHLNCESAEGKGHSGLGLGSNFMSGTLPINTPQPNSV